LNYGSLYGRGYGGYGSYLGSVRRTVANLAKPKPAKNYVAGRRECEVWRSGHSFVLPLPKRLLRKIFHFKESDMENLTAVWLVFHDGTIVLTLRRADGSKVEDPIITQQDQG